MVAPEAQLTSNRGQALERSVWIAVAIAILIVNLRVFAKAKIHRFWVDDVVMIMAVMLAVIAAGLLSVAVHFGLGQDLDTLEMNDRKPALKYTAIQVPMFTLSSAAARSSFMLYLLAILTVNQKSRTALWVTLFFQISCNVVSAVLPLTICRDVRVLWDTTVTTTCGDATAVLRFTYFAGDLFLAVLPTILFWDLKLKLRVKISLIVLLSLAAVALVASIIKTIKLKEVSNIMNFKRGGSLDFLQWSYGENAILIITSSIPCLRPLIMSSVRKISSRGGSQSYELAARRNHQHHTRTRITCPSERLILFRDTRVDNVDNTEPIPSPTASARSVVAEQSNRPANPHGSITKEVTITVTSVPEPRSLPAFLRLHKPIETTCK